MQGFVACVGPLLVLSILCVLSLAVFAFAALHCTADGRRCACDTFKYCRRKERPAPGFLYCSYCTALHCTVVIWEWDGMAMKGLVPRVRWGNVSEDEEMEEIGRGGGRG